MPKITSGLLAGITDGLEEYSYTYLTMLKGQLSELYSKLQYQQLRYGWSETNYDTSVDVAIDLALIEYHLRKIVRQYGPK